MYLSWLTSRSKTTQFIQQVIRHSSYPSHNQWNLDGTKLSFDEQTFWWASPTETIQSQITISSHNPSSCCAVGTWPKSLRQYIFLSLICNIHIYSALYTTTWPVERNYLDVQCHTRKCSGLKAVYSKFSNRSELLEFEQNVHANPSYTSKPYVDISNSVLILLFFLSAISSLMLIPRRKWSSPLPRSR